MAAEKLDIGVFVHVQLKIDRAWQMMQIGGGTDDFDERCDWVGDYSA